MIPILILIIALSSLIDQNKRYFDFICYIDICLSYTIKDMIELFWILIISEFNYNLIDGKKNIYIYIVFYLKYIIRLMGYNIIIIISK